MKLLSTTLLATSLVLSSAAMASTSNGINLSVNSHTGDQAVVKVTQDGEPLANYPVEIKGFGPKQAMTDENGMLVVSNVAGSGMNYVFTVQDEQGNKISEDAFLANKRR
ncbi:hypothetical protein [Vibrio litoralis]|uniref:hypothetical protein n=1 Tax=Vibrio litoralis TaxID=335972 RepID=UPI00040E0E53|nr:hypothetical protein [Vibrio litoralis]